MSVRDKLPASVRAEYNRLRSSGVSPEDARRALNLVRGDGGYVQSRGAIEESARGVTLGGIEAITGLGLGIGFLGRPIGLGGLEEASLAARERAKEALDPRGKAGAAGRLVGRIGGEVATTFGTAGLGKLGAARLAPRAAETARAALEGSRAARAAAAAAPDVVLSAPRAIGDAVTEEGEIDKALLAQNLALELGGSALGGYLATMGPSLRIAPETDVGRMIPPVTTRDSRLRGAIMEDLPEGVVYGPERRVFPMRGEVSPEEAVRRVEAAAATREVPSPSIIERPTDVLTPRTRQRQAAYLRRIEKAETAAETAAKRQRFAEPKAGEVAASIEAAQYAGETRRATEAPRLIYNPRTGGFVMSQALQPIAGAGIGATVGGLTSEDPLGGALAGAYIGAGLPVGAAATRRVLKRTATTTAQPASIFRRSLIGKTEPSARSFGFPNYLSKRDFIKSKIFQESAAPLGLLERQALEKAVETGMSPKEAKAFARAQRDAADSLIAQAQGSNGASLVFIAERLQPFFSRPGEELGSLLDGLMGKRSIATLDNAYGDIQNDVADFALRRREYASRQAGNAPKLGISDEELAEDIVAGMSNPRLVAATDELQKFFRDLLDMRVAAGQVTEEAADAIRKSDDYYTPFLSDYWVGLKGLPSTKGGPLTVGGTGVSAMNRELASDALKVNPFEVAIIQAQKTFADVGKQRFQNFFQSFIPEEGVPGVINILPAGKKADPRARVFQAIRDGKMTRYEVADENLFNAIAMNNNVSQTRIAKFARKLADIKRYTVTALPDFAAASLARDLVGYAIQRPAKELTKEIVGGAAGGAALGAAASPEDRLRGATFGAIAGAGMTPLAKSGLEVMDAMKSILMNDDAFKRFASSGAITQGFNVRDIKSAKKIIRDLRRTGGDKDILSFDSWSDAINAIADTVSKPSQIAELSPRLAAFNKAVANGMSEADAAKFAQDVTLRFANKGSATKGYASYTPFFNARLQGWDKLGRLIADPKTLAASASIITAPTIALWAINKDNPEYWEQPTYVKNLFWLLPKDGGGFYKIPKPFEIGYLFASLPERMLDYAARSGDEGIITDSANAVMSLLGEDVRESAAPQFAEPGRELVGTLKEAAMSPISGSLMLPPLVEAPLQQMANYSFFRDRPIEPAYMADRPAEYRYYTSTPGLARMAGRAGLSPLKVEQFVSDVGGTMGKRAMTLADIPLRAAGLPASESTRAPRTTPEVLGEALGASRFVTSDVTRSQIEYEAEDRINEFEQTYRSLQQKISEGAPAQEIQRFESRNMSDLIAHSELQGARSELRNIQRERNSIERRRDISPQEKEDIIKSMNSYADQISRFILGYKVNE